MRLRRRFGPWMLTAIRTEIHARQRFNRMPAIRTKRQGTARTTSARWPRNRACRALGESSNAQTSYEGSSRWPWRGYIGTLDQAAACHRQGIDKTRKIMSSRRIVMLAAARRTDKRAQAWRACPIPARHHRRMSPMHWSAAADSTWPWSPSS